MKNFSTGPTENPTLVIAYAAVDAARRTDTKEVTLSLRGGSTQLLRFTTVELADETMKIFFANL